MVYNNLFTFKLNCANQHYSSPALSNNKLSRFIDSYSLKDTASSKKFTASIPTFARSFFIRRKAWSVNRNGDLVTNLR